MASGNFATPVTLLHALAAAVERCRVFVLNAQSDFPQHPGFISETPFVGPGMRHDPGLDYLPMRLSLVPRLFDSVRPVDAVLLHTSVPRDGKVSLGIEVNILPAAIERVHAAGGLIVAQMNPHMPYTFGDSEIPSDWVDLAVEVDDPLACPAVHPLEESAERIGRQAARFADDGATLQLGIGQIPDVAASELNSRRNLGIWSEMISDGVLGLEQAGSLDPRRPIRASFLFGTPELYAWADRNPRLQMHRTEFVNDPGRIADNPAMLSINMALQIDLFAQANASFVRGAVYSGFGGQPDFVAGALHSPGGHAVVALHSWHDKSDTSSVLPVLTNPVTSFQHTAIVSEQGCAELFGRSESAQARLIIDRVAHPRARESLLDAAGALGLLGASRSASR
ncbi:MAG: acetyl-CoA hydrolase/transferase family protein [Acidimicrobiales bacterium]